MKFTTMMQATTTAGHTLISAITELLIDSKI